METKRYAVYRSSDPGGRPTPFVCHADSAVGSGARFTLWDACRALERVTEREHGRWIQAPKHETAAPERAAGMER